MWHAKGFVLVIVLFFLQLFALIGLYALKETAGLVKVTNAAWQREVLLQDTLAILKRLESSLQPVCFIPITIASDIIKKPTLWWQAHACSDKVSGIHYHYVIELLGKDIYRLTLLSLSDQINGMRIILQSTVINGTRHAWREI